tara:strand:+ start:405 stop:665 length:261 start_codon:yes stop_codon:yes gene_type:complete
MKINFLDYLKQNIKPDILQKANEFKNSSNYKAIKSYSLSDKYQSAKMQLKLRDKNIENLKLKEKVQDNSLFERQKNILQEVTYKKK